MASHGRLVASIVARHGPIDVAVLAFGILGDQARAESDAAHAVAIVHTDYVAQVSLLTHLAAEMRAVGRGSLVVFSSVAGVRVRRANYVYGSAKAGLDGFASGLADSLHGTGVRLLIARPGFVIGRMTAGMPPAPLSSTPAAGRRGHRAGTGPRATDGVDPVGAAAGVLRHAAAAAIRLAADAAMTMIVVVGIGADGMPGLAEASRRELRSSHRRLRIQDDNSTCSTTRWLRARREWPSPLLPALPRLLDGGTDVHVLASGDPLSARHRRHPDPAVRAATGDGAAARVGGDAGLRADGLDGARHRGDQPGHRRTAHGGTPRRPGDRAVPRPRHRRRRWQRCSTRTAAPNPSSPFSSSWAARGSVVATAPRDSGPLTRPPTSTISTWSRCATCRTSACSSRPTRRFTTTARSPNTGCGR